MSIDIDVEMKLEEVSQIQDNTFVNTSQFVHNQLYKTHQLSDSEYFISLVNDRQVLWTFKTDYHSHIIQMLKYQPIYCVHCINPQASRKCSKVKVFNPFMYQLNSYI